MLPNWPKKGSAVNKNKAEEERKKEESDHEEKPEITIDDFAKIELKVATVIAAEKHPKADKLLVLQLKVGDETRQVVSGIAENTHRKN
jgi:methionyl-tRNA synthetase